MKIKEEIERYMYVFMFIGLAGICVGLLFKIAIVLRAMV
jgi:hypothetical protein